MQLKTVDWMNDVCLFILPFILCRLIATYPSLLFSISSSFIKKNNLSRTKCKSFTRLLQRNEAGTIKWQEEEERACSFENCQWNGRVSKLFITIMAVMSLKILCNTFSVLMFSIDPYSMHFIFWIIVNQIANLDEYLHFRTPSTERDDIHYRYSVLSSSLSIGISNYYESAYRNFHHH